MQARVLKGALSFPIFFYYILIITICHYTLSFSNTFDNL